MNAAAVSAPTNPERSYITPIVHRFKEDQGEEWCAFLNARERGEQVEIDEAMFYYWLEVLPPVYQSKKMVVGGKERLVSFGFAEGSERITAFWREGNRYFCQRTNEIHPGC